MEPFIQKYQQDVMGKLSGFDRLMIHGFRNRDMVPLLNSAGRRSVADTRRASARITRKIRLLRAHGIIRKVTGTHRYLLTKKGRAITTAIIEYQNLTLQELNKLSA